VPVEVPLLAFKPFSGFGMKLGSIFGEGFGGDVGASETKQRIKGKAD
jgi:hypothetical protein